jgi:predicted nucleic-acid-binding protein
MKKRYLLTTNDLVSYLMSKQLETNSAATTVFHDTFKGKCAALLEDFILIEAITQFEQSFQIPRERIQQVLTHLLRYKGLVVLDAAALLQALQLYGQSTLPFGSCLLHAKVQLRHYTTIEPLPALPTPSPVTALAESL